MEYIEGESGDFSFLFLLVYLPCRHLKDKHRVIQDEGSKRQKKLNKERACAETLTTLRKQGEVSPDHIAVAVALFTININMPLSMVNNAHMQNLLMLIPGMIVV